jgi:hypothetical protein
MLCGICNKEIPNDYVRFMFKENDDSVTHYCVSHEKTLNELKPCEDCGHHRKLCNDCKEGE